jgi:hypothetical protein
MRGVAAERDQWGSEKRIVGHHSNGDVNRVTIGMVTHSEGLRRNATKES